MIQIDHVQTESRNRTDVKPFLYQVRHAGILQVPALGGSDLSMSGQWCRSLGGRASPPLSMDEERSSAHLTPSMAKQWDGMGSA